MKLVSSKTLKQLILLVFLFILGLFSLIFLHIFFQKLITNLDERSNNFKAKIHIGKYIITDLYRIRSKFYELATTATNSRSREIIQKRIEKRIDEIKKSLNVLENGGKLERVIRLNIAGHNDATETIVYKKYENTIPLEAIDLLPKLIEFEKMSQEISDLLKEQDLNKKEKRIEEFIKLNTKIKRYYKRTPPFFIRITENANRLLYEGSLELEKLENEIKEQKSYYSKVEIVLVFIILLLISILASIIAIQINRNTKEIEKQNKSIRGVLDAQKNIVIVSNGENMIDANRALVDFFEKYKNFEDFKKAHLCICDFFEDIGKEDYLLNMDYNGLKWYEYIINNPQIPHKVAMRSNSNKSIDHFSISAEKKTLDEYTFIVIVVLNKITEEIINQEELRNLNYNLEDIVNEKTKELQELNENLESRIVIEVEKNREKDKRMIQQSRFAALGEMIGNIAHQWRQPLSAISSTVTSMQIQRELNIASNKDVDKSYRDILKYIDFLNQTIEDFRTFFKKDKEKTEFDIAKTLKNTISIVNAMYKNHSILLIENFDKNREYKIFGFPSEVTQVLLNILNNSKDILIEKKIKTKIVKIDIEKTQEFYTIKITDNAGGIDKEIKDKIFDPYFTTKHKAQGTGIGLYMSKDIIEKHMNGSLTAENCEFTYEDNKQFGACFIIKLPRF